MYQIQKFGSIGVYISEYKAGYTMHNCMYYITFVTIT